MIKLNTSERVYTLMLLNQFKGNLDTLVGIMEDIKKVKITEEEWKKAKREIVESTGFDGKPITNWTWDDSKGGEKEIVFAKETKDYLIKKINELNDKGEFTLQDRAAISLKGKLEK
jgi:hypothetical protein